MVQKKNEISGTKHLDAKKKKTERFRYIYLGLSYFLNLGGIFKMSKNIGKKVKLTAMGSKVDAEYEIVAEVGTDLYVCRNEAGELTRLKKSDVKIIK